MTDTGTSSFRFGIEAEYQLAEAETLRPLWHQDLTFQKLNEMLESIYIDDIPPLDGLELEWPHRKLMPFAVEGYHLPSPDLSPIGLLPKGVEIRTPVCSSIEECLDCLKRLHDRLASAMLDGGYVLVSLSHHPTEYQFEGSQNKRRYDYWQWAMEVMCTYGPDINVSLPRELNRHIDIADLHRRVNYYSPALAALSLASPIYRGNLWRIRGQVGKSIRTYRRSVIAPAIEVHPEEGDRMEFKLFEATNRLDDYRAYFLLWLTLLLDDRLTGRSHNQTRIYDLGMVARFGMEAETVRQRADAVLTRAPLVLQRYGFDASALALIHKRLEADCLPSDEIVQLFSQNQSLTEVLSSRTGLVNGTLAEPELSGNGASRINCRQSVTEN